MTPWVLQAHYTAQNIYIRYTHKQSYHLIKKWRIWSDMSNSNNTIILEGCVDEFREQNEIDLDDSELFELFSLSQITKNYELSYDEIQDAIVDGGRDGGIDSFLILINDDSISSKDELGEFKFTSSSIINVYIVQAKTEKSFTESTLDKLIASIPFLYDFELKEDELLVRFNNSLVEKILTFRDVCITAIKKGSKIKIGYFYSCKASDIQKNGSFDSKVKQIIDSTNDRIHGAEINFFLYSSKELLELYKKSKTSKLELKYKETPMSVTYSGNQIGYLGVVNLKDYYSLITDNDGNLRENLFENNIRHYQGDVDVNKSIQNSLNSDLVRDFWWLNNGITIIASNVGQFGKTLTLENIQIVNGLQTSYTIGKYYNIIEADDRSILVKVIINTDKETIDKIISATNSQNLISPTLLRATENTQRLLELYFYNKGYYYDRRKNFYKNQGKPSSKIFSIQYTAQAIEAIKNFNPASARSKPTTLIKENSSYNKIFDPDINFEVFLNCCLIAQKTSQYINAKLSSDQKGQARNFKYHISRIVTSIITSKSYYNYTDLEIFNINLMNDDNLNSAYELLNHLINSYNIEFPSENVINIAKSKKFVDKINEYLLEKYPPT